jgi:hypothetical protein
MVETNLSMAFQIILLLVVAVSILAVIGLTVWLAKHDSKSNRK